VGLPLVVLVLPQIRKWLQREENHVTTKYRTSWLERHQKVPSYPPSSYTFSHEPSHEKYLVVLLATSVLLCSILFIKKKIYSTSHERGRNVHII